MKYRLIQLDPLALYNKSINGLPPTLVRDVAAPTTPAGYAYVEELAYPEEAPAEGFIWSRKLTVDAYGWEQVVTPDDEIEPEWYEVPAWRVRAIAAVTPYEDGLLIDAITVAINSIVDPLEKVTAQEVFFGGNTLHRTSTLLVTMAAGLGLSDNQLDDLFQQAYAIVV
jgi:hypothetical protein